MRIGEAEKFWTLPSQVWGPKCFCQSFAKGRGWIIRSRLRFLCARRPTNTCFEPWTICPLEHGQGHPRAAKAVQNSAARGQLSDCLPGEKPLRWQIWHEWQTQQVQTWIFAMIMHVLNVEICKLVEIRLRDKYAHTHTCTYLVSTHLQTMHMEINGTWHSKQSVVTGETIYNLGVRLHTPWYEFHLDDILQRCNNRSLIPKRCVWLCLQIIMTCHGVLRCVRAVEVGILDGNGFKDSGWWFDSRTRRTLIVVSPSRFALHPFALGGWGSLWKWFAREVASKSMPQSTSVDAQ